MNERFRPSAHVPLYSRLLLETIRTPAFLFLFIAGNLVLTTGSIGFYFTEQAINPNVTSIVDAFWWGIATVTTVGFGDIVPMTIGGRLIGFALLGTGVLLFVGSTAILSTTFFARTQAELLTLEEETKVGWQQVLAELSELRREVRELRGDPAPS